MQAQRRAAREHVTCANERRTELLLGQVARWHLAHADGADICVPLRPLCAAGTQRKVRVQHIRSARRVERTSLPCASRCGEPCRARCPRRTFRPRAPAHTRRTAAASRSAGSADRPGFRPPPATRLRSASAPQPRRAAPPAAPLRPQPAAVVVCSDPLARPAARGRRARPRHRPPPRPTPWRAEAGAIACAPQRARQQLEMRGRESRTSACVVTPSRARPCELQSGAS